MAEVLFGRGEPKLRELYYRHGNPDKTAGKLFSQGVVTKGDLQ